MIIKGSANTDVLVGTPWDDTLIGGGGNDILAGSYGNDTFMAGQGLDTIYGGSGSDTVSYENEGPAVVDLAAGFGYVTARTAYNDRDALFSVENARGSQFHDNIAGNNGDNVLEGLGGDDQIRGGVGSDTLRGGEGKDTLEGGTGADFLDGGLGKDTAIYTHSWHGVTVNLFGNVAHGGEAEGDTFNSIENVEGSAFGDSIEGDNADNHLIGNDGDDHLLGGAGSDWLYGGDGADTLNGGSGTDILYGGSGADRLFGGTGEDTVDYAGSKAALTVDLEAGRGWGGEAEGDRLYSIELVKGSAFNDSISGSNSEAKEQLYGDRGSDHLYGMGGQDSLFGGDDKDFLDGGAGSDHVEGGSGDDLIVADADGTFDFYDGGADKDTLTFALAKGSVTIDLSAQTASGGDIGGDSFQNIEHVIASDYKDNVTGSYGDDFVSLGGDNDVASGGQGQDRFEGGSGNDKLYGGAGDDRLFGDDGNDTLVGGAGADFLRGDYGWNSAGKDTFVFNAISEIGYGFQSRDTIFDFEHGVDHIDLSAIDAKSGTSANDAFTFIGTSDFSGVAGELHKGFDFDNQRTVVEGDVNGDAKADFQIEIRFDSYLTAADFIL